MKHKNWHEWGVVAQCHFPYREFHYCPLCRQYNEAGAKPYMTKKQFNQLAMELKETNPMYYADSYDLLEVKVKHESL